MVGHGGSSAGSYLADPSSPIPSHCASIVAISTLRVNGTKIYRWHHTLTHKPGDLLEKMLWNITRCPLDSRESGWLMCRADHSSSILKFNTGQGTWTHNAITYMTLQIMGKKMSRELSRHLNSYSASDNSWCIGTLVNRVITAQWEGMGDVGAARYEPALLPPCPTIRVLCYSNCQRSTHSHQQFKG